MNNSNFLAEIKKELSQYASPEKAEKQASFFKTDPGEYGHGDQFIGVRVPEVRMVSKNWQHLTSSEIKKLICSPVHEERLLALLILVLKFEKADRKEQKDIFWLYVGSYKFVNNWDLVDLSAPKIMGAYLHTRSKDILYEWSNSTDLWKKRMCIVSTYYFIKNGSYEDTLALSHNLLKDKHDLIHKAVGWMLREVGKSDVKTLEKFLDVHCKHMPRTMLRYAIEHFPPQVRKKYMA